MVSESSSSDCALPDLNTVDKRLVTEVGSTSIAISNVNIVDSNLAVDNDMNHILASDENMVDNTPFVTSRKYQKSSRTHRVDSSDASD